MATLEEIAKNAGVNYDKIGIDETTGGKVNVDILESMAAKLGQQPTAQAKTSLFPVTQNNTPSSDVSPFGMQQDAYNDYLNQEGAPDYETIRNQMSQQAQQMANLIRSQYAPVFDRHDDQSMRRNARTQAQNVGAGLAGSTFASSQAQQTEDENEHARRMIEQEMQAKVAAIMGEVSTRASEEFRKQRELYLAEADNRIERTNEYLDQARNAYSSNLQGLAASGMTLDEIRQQYPEEYKQLVADAGDLGMSEFAMEWQYANSIPKESVIDKRQVGNSIVFFFQDPTDPTKIRAQAVGLPEDETLGQSEDIIDDGYGNPIIVTYSGEPGKSTIVSTRSVDGAVTRSPYSDAYSSEAGKLAAQQEYASEEGWSFEPTKDERSLVQRYLASQKASDEDWANAKKDENYFYMLLREATKASAGDDADLERDPFQSSNVINL